MWAESLTSGARRHICSAYFVFVLAKYNQDRSPLPQVVPTTTDDQRRFFEAMERREIRLRLDSDDLLDQSTAPHEEIKEVGPTRSQLDSVVNMTKFVLPEHANAIQTLFGGVSMAWMFEGK